MCIRDRYWGEALLLGGALHGVSYSQSPLDLQKGFATPGVEAKELFRPLESISGQLTVTPELSLAAQYFFQWEGSRIPEGGTYLGPIDPIVNGPERVVTGFGIGPRGKTSKPDENGEFALTARWSPAALDATLGLSLIHICGIDIHVELHEIARRAPEYLRQQCQGQNGGLIHVVVEGHFKEGAANPVDEFR